MNKKREAIYKEIERYWQAREEVREPFIPGKSYIPYSGAVYGVPELWAMVDTILDGWFGVGKKGAKFEQKLYDYIGMKQGTLVNSGSSANLIAVTALMEGNIKGGMRPGDEVITPATTFPTTFNPILQNDLVPVLLDVDQSTYNMSTDLLEEALSATTRMIAIPHTLGNPHDMDTIMGFAKDHDLFVLEDSCDALGSRFDGKMCGSFGDISTYSFYPAHHMTMGEGGAILTNSSEIAKVVRSLRDWGRACWCRLDEKNPLGSCSKRFEWQLKDLPYGFDHKYIYSTIGYNLKPLELQAAMGLIQFERLDDFERRRKRNFKLLYLIFENYEDFLILPSSVPKGDPNWFALPLTIKKGAPFTRHEIVKFFEKHNIATRHIFAGNILRHPAYANSNYRIVGELKNSDLVLTNAFFLGVYPGLTPEHIDYIGSIAEKFFTQIGDRS